MRPRVVPVMTLDRRSLVKTTKFSDPLYLGDPVNALRVFNSKLVDEVVILDITASGQGRLPDISYLAELAGECFMPVSFGGGVKTCAQAEEILIAGVEKVVVNTAAIERLGLLSEMADHFGSQAVVGSLDVIRSRRGRYRVANTSRGVKSTKMDPVEWASRLVDAGAGEVLVTAVDREGMASGYDLELVSLIAAGVPVPVVACGGASSLRDLWSALSHGASAAGAGRMFVTRGKHRAALVSYPTPEEVEGLTSPPPAIP